MPAPTLPLDQLCGQGPLFGIPGPGRWLIACYRPTTLFSLKMSAASSGVGRTLLIPTPYAFKMSLLDVAMVHGWEGNPEQFVCDLAAADLRVGVPARAIVTHTIIKIRQEPKTKTSGVAYTPAVAYREFVAYEGLLRWALDLATLPQATAEAVISLAPAVSYIGKRGGFIQFTGWERSSELNSTFTQTLDGGDWTPPSYSHLAVMDDFGPEATFSALNSYSSAPIKRGRHRKFVRTLVPLGVVNEGPGFTEYRGEE